MRVRVSTPRIPRFKREEFGIWHELMTEIYRWRDPKPIFENLDNKRAEKPTGRWLERSWVLGLGGPIPPSPVPFPSPSDPSRLWTWARPFPKFRGGLGCLGLEGVRNASTHATSPVSTQGWRVVCRHWVPLIPQVVGPACLDPSYRVREGGRCTPRPRGMGGTTQKYLGPGLSG